MTDSNMSLKTGARAESAFRERVPSTWEATWLIWYRVPGKVTAVSLAFASVVFLAILAAGINHVLGPDGAQQLGGDDTPAIGERLHFIVVGVLLVGFPLLFPALFRLAGRRVGRGRCSPTAASGAVFEGDRCVAAYRPDGRLFGYEPTALSEVVSGRGANAYAGGLLRVPLPTWRRFFGGILIVGLLLMIPMSVWMRHYDFVAEVPAFPFFALAPLMLLFFDSWLVQASPKREQWRLRSWIPWHPALRAAIETARNATVERLSRWQQGRRD